MSTETLRIDVSKTGALTKIADFKHFHKTRFVESVAPKLALLGEEGTLLDGFKVYCMQKPDGRYFGESLRITAKTERGVLTLTASTTEE